jgi:hypothetical protein
MNNVRTSSEDDRVRAWVANLVYGRKVAVNSRICTAKYGRKAVIYRDGVQP